jgi:hypothetical protein
MLYGLCGKKAMRVVDEETFVDEKASDVTRGEEKGGCARDPL